MLMLNRVYFIFIVVQFLGWSNVNAQSRLTNLATIYINTENKAGIESKDDYVNASLEAVSGEPSEEISGAAIQIRGRGNSTWRMPKKSYRIKFASKLHFLNLPAKEDDWVLLANYSDKTLMRNAVAFEMSSQLGFEWTPSVKFVDLVINGNYVGNYMVSDQVERKNDRVPLEKLDPSMVSLPEISGGYLLESDGFADGIEQFKTRQGIDIVIKYPDDDDINDSQRQYISSYTQEFEDALFSPNFTDQDSGYPAYVDVPTLVNYYIICEFTGNPDGFWSTFFYKKRNDPLFKFGPVWDFDIAFNNDRRLGDAKQKLMKDAAHNPKQWIGRFLEDQELENQIARRWEELKEQGILDHLLSYVDNLEVELEASQQKNFERWDILGREVYLELEARGSYEAEVDFLRNYIIDRYEFLDSQWKVQVPSREVELLAQSDDKRVLIPKSDVGQSWRSDITYNDDAWELLPGYPAGVGYEKSSGYDNLITLDVGGDMHSDGGAPNSSCYLRIPFTIEEEDLEKFTDLKLMVYYDDGFVAYLNGQKVHEVNAPVNPVWNSAATEQHEARSEDIINLTDKLSLLQEGENLLAIHGLNADLSSSDFIIAPRLNAYEPIAAEEEEDDDEDEEEDVVTAIGEPLLKEISRISPNPVVSSATVSFYLGSPSEIQFYIYDQRGRLVVNQISNGKKGRNTIPVSVSKTELVSGVYEVKVVTGQQMVFREKMVVIR